MSTQRQISMFFVVVILGAICLMASTEASAASPVQTQKFKSSSGKTQIEYYAYKSGQCGAGLSCDFQGSIHVARGYEQAEVFLSGFELEAATQADAVSQVTVSVSKKRYIASTGELNLSVIAVLRTRSGQNYSYRVSFVVILTAGNVAYFSPVSTGCSGVASCRIVRSFPSAIPRRMHYIGIATHNWSVGSLSGPLVLNTLSAHQDGLTVQPPSVHIEYLCAMWDKTQNKRMFCEWGAKVIAFDPAEMEQNGSSIFPQYTFASWGTNVRHYWTNHSASPSRTRIAGFLDAFEGLTLTYQTFPYMPNVQYPVWLIESSAGNFQVSGNAPDTALTDYGIFLGSNFGNYTTAQKFAFQESRAFGFLR